MAEQGQDSRIKPSSRKGGAPAPAQRSDQPKRAAQTQPADRKPGIPHITTEPTGLRAAIRALFRSTPSWLTSMLVHVGILMAMGLMTLPEVTEHVAEMISSVGTEMASPEDITSDVLDPGMPTGSLD